MLSIPCHVDQNIFYWFSVELHYPSTHLGISFKHIFQLNCCEKCNHWFANVDSRTKTTVKSFKGVCGCKQCSVCSYSKWQRCIEMEILRSVVIH